MSPKLPARPPAGPVPAPPPPKPAGPGRPKDLSKRQAILDAARQMFTAHGFDGASMDQIAAAAGVSKLTVYSHFGDKETLFAEVVKSYCETQLPDAIFEAALDTPLRERLLEFARAFFAMICASEAVAGHRILCSPQIAGSNLPRLFWESGPRRVQAGFATLLERRIAAGELAIDDVPRAASQFFSLLKGEPHAQLVFGCCEAADPAAVETHLAASVDLFLRAYAPVRTGG